MSPTASPHIIVIGGGLTLDVGGFAAAILSAKLTLVPTTFLACVDATIGGKTGVNVEPYGKNQVGCFYFCDEIIIAPHFLKTLSNEAVVSGLCEALKHSWLSGDFYENRTIFENILDNGLNAIENDINSFILNNLETKLKIVSQDPFERTEIRKILNFGHTYAHVLEMLTLRTKNPMPHGIAVAHGMAIVIKRFYLQRTPEMNAFFDFLNRILLQFPYDFEMDLETKKEYASLFRHDKKNEDLKKISFILPQYGQIKAKETGHGYIEPHYYFRQPS